MKRMDDIGESNNFVPLLAFIFAKDANIDDSLRFQTYDVGVDIGNLLLLEMIILRQ